LTSGQNMMKNPEGRIPEIDVFRAFILLYMAFVNLYYALAREQLPFLSHHGKIMSGGDLIIIYFFLMLGFNLALAQKFRKLDAGILCYGWKRGLFLIWIGMALISYQFISEGFQARIFLRSFLVALGLGLILISLLVYLCKFRVKLVFAVALLFTGQMFIFSSELGYEINYLTPYFLLSSIWGYYLGLIFLESMEKFLRFSLIFTISSLLLAFMHMIYYQTVPSRQTMNAPYFLISWAVILGFFSLFLKSGVYRKFFSKSMLFRKIGSHPLSFWIIQSIVIAWTVIIATLVHYAQNNSLAFFWGFPYKLRTIESLSRSITISLVVTVMIAIMHAAYVDRFSKKKIWTQINADFRRFFK
jgi:hypothetical protein